MTTDPGRSSRRPTRRAGAAGPEPAVAAAGGGAPSAAALRPIVRVLASAGTGKTHSLTTRLIHLLADGAEIDDVFAATFARKAAGEILARLLSRLAAAADPAAPAATARLAAEIGRPSADAGFFRDLLVRVTGRIERLKVGTLDAFFVTCADAARYELGLPPGWSIGSEADLEIQRRRAIHRTISEAIAAGRSDADVGDSPAGLLARLMVQLSGDRTTTGLEESIEEVVADLAAIHRESEPSAWDWLAAPRPPSPEKLSAAVERLRAHSFDDSRLADARDAAIEALGDSDWKALLSKGMVPKILAGETTYQRKPIGDAVADDLRTLVDVARSVLLARFAGQTRAIRDLLDHYSAAADRLMADEGMVSFDDVTRLVGSAAGDGTLDAARWRGIAFAKHLLLDEFQDTSPGQWRVLERLAEHAVSASGTFFAVGDRKQAIYGWRGGAAELIDALPDFFARGRRPLESLTLEKSYRSSQAVLDAVNRVFGRIAAAEPLAEHRPTVDAAVSGFIPHTTAHGELPGWVRLRTCRAVEEGEKARDVLLAAAAARAAALSRANPGRTVGVLVRTNAAAERVIAALKAAEGIVASSEGGQPLADSPAVELVLSALHLVDHPSDTTARFHVATSPLAAVVGLDPAGATGPTSPECVATLDRLRRGLFDEGYGPILARFAATLAPACPPRDLRRLEQLVATAHAWDLDGSRTRQGGARTAPFVHHCRTVNVADPVASPIRVMTIHKAKGLEFDLVVLTDLDRRLVVHPPRVVVDRESPLAPVRRILVHVPKEFQALLPRDWRDVCGRANAPVIREAIATLYVGLTRAARGMEILVQPASGREKTIPKTLAGVLRATLPDTADAAEESVLWRHGHLADAEVDALPGAEDRAAVAAESAPGPDAAVASPIVLRPMPGGRRRRARPLRTPSSTEGGRIVAAESLLDAGSRVSRAVGTLLHSWIEQFGWPARWPGDDRLRGLASRHPELAAQVETLLRDFRAMTEAPAVAALLAEPERRLPDRFVDAGLPAGPADPQLERERAFALDGGEETLLGVTDRLVIWRRGGRPVAAQVVDFKFDGMGTAGGAGPDERARILAAKREFYAPQLRAYRTAVAAILGLPATRVACDLVFMRSGDVAPVEG